MTSLPKNGVYFVQDNRGSRLGDIYLSYNLDLTSNLGMIRVSPRMLLNVNKADLANLDAPPCAFRFFTTSNPGIWAIAKQRMFHNATSSTTGGPNTTFIQDATSGSPTSLNSDVSDMEIFVSTLVVTGATDSIFLLSSSGTWSTITSKLTSTSGLHQMTKFRAQNKVYIVDDNAAGITSLATDLSTTVKSSSGSQYSLNDLVEGAGVNVGSEISWIESNSTRIWIGTINKSSGGCKIYAWDGSSASGPNEEYAVAANGTLACVIMNDEPVVIDTMGRLLQRNGASFTPLENGKLPFEIKNTPKSYFTTATNRLVHHNGMSIVNGRINVLVNAQLFDTNSTIKSNASSGIYEYEPSVGLYLKHTLGLSKAGATITDFGAHKISKVGALQEMDVPNTAITQGSINGKFICGAGYYTNASTESFGIWYDDTADSEEKYGVLVTSWLTTENLKEIWQSINARIRKLLNSTDKIVVKYRTDDVEPVEFTGTWASTTTFNTPNDLRDYVGYEVTPLNGVGSGRCGHILTVTENGASGWLVTLDTTYTGATGTFKGRYENFTKAGTHEDQIETVPEFSFLSCGNAPAIQVKICMNWTGKNEVFDFIINSTKAQ